MYKLAEQLSCPNSGGAVCRCLPERKDLSGAVISVSAVALNRLFDNYAFFQEMFLRSTLLGIPDTAIIRKNLDGNRILIVGDLRLILLEKNAEEFALRWLDHLNLTATLAESLIREPGEQFRITMAKLYENAAELGKIVHRVNPSDVSEAGLIQVFQNLVYLYQLMALHLKKGDYEKHFAAYEDFHTQAIVIADTLNRSVRVSGPIVKS